MHHLFDYWRQVIARIEAAGAIALFLDFDGTLAPFRARPEDAGINFATRNALARLAIHPRIRVWIVSGRRRADLQARTGIPRIDCLGLHGWENGARPRLRKDAQSSLERARRALAGRVRTLPGIWIEDKGPVFSVHFRGAPDRSINEANFAVRSAIASAGGLRAIPGKLSWEILPFALGDKGTAVRRQLTLLPTHVLPIYAGDDRTDEPAFAALPHGITIRVGPAALTRASFQLRDPGEVRVFLERLSST